MMKIIGDNLTFNISVSFKLKSSNWNECSCSVAALGTFCLQIKF